MTKGDSVRGIKAFNADLSCRGMRYEVGKVSEVPGPLKLCDHGLHYCNSVNACTQFYGLDSRFCEVEALGEVVTDGFKSATDKLLVVRELTRAEACRRYYGYGYGYGNGDGYGDGNGDGDGYGDGNGDGDGYGYGYGNGDGYGNDYGNGDGNGYGYGYGYGNGDGYGDGNGNGNGKSIYAIMEVCDA